MQLIQHQELGSAQSGIAFTSIPQNYTDLMVVFSIRASSNVNRIYFSFNGSADISPTRALYGFGSGSGSSETDVFPVGINPSGSTANTFANCRLYVPNYTSNTGKIYSIDSVTENNGTTAYQNIHSGIWNFNDAINSLAIIPIVNNITIYSSATLYGITKGTDGITTAS